MISHLPVSNYYVRSVLFLYSFLLSVYSFAQERNFAFYSSHVPFLNENEALTFKAKASSFVISLNESTDKKNQQSSKTRFTTTILIPANWVKNKIVLHIPAQEKNYEVFINDTLQSDFQPIAGVPNEWAIIKSSSSDSVRVAVQTLSTISPLQCAYIYTIGDVHLTELNPNGYFINGEPWLYINVKKQNFSSQKKNKLRYKVSLYDINNINLIAKEHEITDKNRGVYLDSLQAFENQYYSFGCRVKGVKAWTDETPNIYRVTIQVKDNEDEILEVFSFKVGFRNISYQKDRLLLNKKIVKLKGVEYKLNVPTTIDTQEFEKEIIRLKNNNINALLLKPGLLIPEFIELCDEHGIFVIVEFEEQLDGGAQQLRNQFSILQNHPSIIAWYANSSEKLYNQLETINKEYNFWKAVHIAGNWNESSKKQTSHVLSFDRFPLDSVTLKSHLNNSFVTPLIFKSDKPPKEINNLAFSRSLNSTMAGLTGVFLAKVNFKEPIPGALTKLYQWISFEETDKQKHSFYVVPSNLAIDPSLLEYHYELRKENTVIEKGILVYRNKHPGQVGQVKIEFKEESLHSCRCDLIITAIRKNITSEEYHPIGECEFVVNSSKTIGQ